MHFSAQEEYGLRCVLQLARRHGDEALTAREISENELISLDYVHKLLGILKRKGLIESTRGIKGGFRLKKPPEEITVCQVLKMLSSEINADGHCAKFDREKSPCPRGGDCEIRLFWDIVFQFCEEYGKRITVQNLIDRKVPNVSTEFKRCSENRCESSAQAAGN
ncbi:Rrf2 family transcriptional regulator [bacterium]|nr:Rrf2 family transcriptional regulator [bacterium]